MALLLLASQARPPQPAPLSPGSQSSVPSTPASWPACQDRTAPFPPCDAQMGWQAGPWAKGRGQRPPGQRPPALLWVPTDAGPLSPVISAAEEERHIPETAPGTRGEVSRLPPSSTRVLPSSGGVSMETIAPQGAAHHEPHPLQHMSWFRSEQQRGKSSGRAPSQGHSR